MLLSLNKVNQKGFGENFENIFKKLDDQNKIIQSLKSSLVSRIEGKIASFELSYHNFVDKSEMKSLKDFASRFANKDMIDNFKDIILPQMKNC